MKESLNIRSLEPDDAASVAQMLNSQSPDYIRFFKPFEFDEATLRSILTKREKDVYMGAYWADELVGFFMLRGWDAGYSVPSYGIIVDEKYCGYGLEIVALETAKSICKLRGAPRLMVKMHPENISAKALARKGFTKAGVETESGNIIYHFNF